MAEATNTTTTPANDDLTLLLGVCKLNEKVDRLHDAFRGFLSAQGDDLAQNLENLIEELIEALDAVEGDVDEEPETDEPTLGALEGHVSQSGAWQLTTSDIANDQDADDADAEPEPNEPSLGSIERSPNGWGSGRDSTGDQTHWGASSVSDMEDEHDGAEPDEDGEPDLGSFDRLTNQAHAWRQQSLGYNAPDLELDNADREAHEPLLTECSGPSVKLR